MVKEVYCSCGNAVKVEGEYPEFFAYCTFCEEDVRDFDCLEYAADVYSERVDQLYDHFRDQAGDD